MKDEENTQLREYIKRIKTQADEHVGEAGPGWGRWQTTQRLCDEALRLKYSHAPNNDLQLEDDE